LTAGDTSSRLQSEASFAALCGVSPVPASSGKVTRHRLNRGGDRAANSALHIIAIGRLTTDLHLGVAHSEGDISVTRLDGTAFLIAQDEGIFCRIAPGEAGFAAGNKTPKRHRPYQTISSKIYNARWSANAAKGVRNVVGVVKMCHMHL